MTFNKMLHNAYFYVPNNRARCEASTSSHSNFGQFSTEVRGRNEGARPCPVPSCPRIGWSGDNALSPLVLPNPKPVTKPSAASCLTAVVSSFTYKYPIFNYLHASKYVCIYLCIRTLSY